MLLLFLAMTLTDAQQVQHDANERRIEQRLQADQAAIADAWTPAARMHIFRRNPTLSVDYGKAQRCYVRFHLYKATSCDAELASVERDLGNLEVARGGSR
jgi:hypothetical protein